MIGLSRTARQVRSTGALPVVRVTPNGGRNQYVFTSGDGRQADADVIMGGEGVKFEPVVMSKKWAGEAWFSIRYPQAVNAETPVVVGDSAELTIGSIRHRYYVRSDGDLEYEFKLLSNPGINVFDFELEHSVGMQFFFQPPLTQFEIDRGNIRPARVVNSYALYHSKENNQYATGKVGHIYRWTLTDAAGASTVGDIEIIPQTATMATLRFTAPAAWLSTATYPVIVGPTVGYTSLGASLDNTNDFMLANKFAAPEAGDANPGTAFFGGKTDVAAIAIIGAYTGTGANPNGVSLLATSGQITLTGTAGFRSAAITWTGITATDYWITVNNDNTGQTSYDAGQTCYFRARTHANDMPDPWGTNEGSADFKVSMYVDYTASGGGAGPTPVPTSISTLFIVGMG